MAEIDVCPVCGSNLDPDAKACNVCGTAFESAPTQCPACNADVGPGGAVCPGCGADLSPAQVDDITQEDVDTSTVPTEEEKGAAEDIAQSVFVNVELEELVKLPGVGPLRAKILFDAGYVDLRKLKQASVVELMNIRGIGRKAAGEIKTALREFSLEQIRETPLTEETVGAENQCQLCGTIVSAFETSCYECGCSFKSQDLDTEDSDRLALSYYDSKLLRTPDNRDLWYARGATLVKMENYEMAINSFNRAIEIDPSFQTAWMSKAEVYNKLGDSAKAAECYSHIITSASGGQMPGAGDIPPSAEMKSEEEDDLRLEKPPEPADDDLTVPGTHSAEKVAEPDLTQPPEESRQEPEVFKPATPDFTRLKMDYERLTDDKTSIDGMSEADLKKELSKRATHVKPYLKLAKEIGVDINNAKKLVARAVTESKQNEFRVAIQLMDDGIEFAETEFRKKITEDIENLAHVIRDLKSQGRDVSLPVSLMTESKELLQAGDIVGSVEKLRVCLEEVEKAVA